MPGLLRELLPFPLVRRELDRVAVAALERFVAVDHRLHAIPSGLELARATGRIPERLRVHITSFAGLPAVDVDAEHLRRGDRAAHLAARLARGVRRDHHKQSAVERRGAARRRERDCESQPRCRRSLRRWLGRRNEQGDGGTNRNDSGNAHG